MAKEQVDWVALDDVMAAADRGLAAVGPELAGFVVLEAAGRLRELGGVIDAAMIAVGTSGHVAMTAQPRSGDEREAAGKLRAVLGALLEIASAPTQALRQCARRREPTGLAALIRELEGALIPLNRAASRRAVARVARVTVEAIEDGRLEPGSYADARREDSAPPAPVVTDIAPRRSAPPPLPTRPPRESEMRVELRAEPAPEPAPPPMPVERAEPPPMEDEATPYVASTFEPCGTPPPAHVEGHAFSASEPASEPYDDEDSLAGEAGFEVVSRLPPIAEPKVIISDPMAFNPQPRRAGQNDRVSQLIESFEISRRRDDPALSRDLKAMVGIETAAPPPVTVHVTARPRTDALDLLVDHEPPSRDVVEQRLPARLGAFSALALVALGAAIATVAARPAMLDVVLGSPLPPPGETAAAATVTAAPHPIQGAPPIPVVCEATLSLEGVAPGSEVLRKLGTTPITITMPMHVPLDLVATFDGMTPRRLHIDANALWQPDATGPRLDVPFALEAASESKWPSSNALTALRMGEGARGLLRATSTPSGASVWVVVDPAMVSGVPCGSAVELMVVPAGGAPKPLRVEWSAFAGSPPRATTKL